MLMTSSDNVPGREIEETIGLVTANAVRARHIGRDILASFKNIIGGEIGAYTQLLRESREQAFAELTATAEAEGADAIVIQENTETDGDTVDQVPAPEPSAKKRPVEDAAGMS